MVLVLKTGPSVVELSCRVCKAANFAMSSTVETTLPIGCHAPDLVVIHGFAAAIGLPSHVGLCQARTLLEGRIYRGARHPQGREDVLRDVVLIALSRDLLDDGAQQGDSEVRVLVLGARRIDQPLGGGRGDKLFTGGEVVIGPVRESTFTR